MRILLVEDDVRLCEAVRFELEREGYTVDVVHEGDDGLTWMRERVYDLVLLDRMLPGLDGVLALRQARAEGITTPVLMVTALDSVEQRVEGLDAGADDYIAKPFDTRELLARMRAMLRRPSGWDSQTSLRAGDLEMDPALKQLTGPGGECLLSGREQSLLEMLLRNHGQTLPRATLLSRVWGPDAAVEDGNLDNYIHFLRRRLRSVGSAMQIKTVRGVGYRLEQGDV